MRVIVEGERAPGLFLLLCGEARVLRGAERGRAPVGPGDVFGEMSLLTARAGLGDDRDAHQVLGARAAARSLPGGHADLPADARVRQRHRRARASSRTSPAPSRASTSSSDASASGPTPAATGSAAVAGGSVVAASASPIGTCVARFCSDDPRRRHLGRRRVGRHAVGQRHPRLPAREQLAHQRQPAPQLGDPAQRRRATGPRRQARQPRARPPAAARCALIQPRVGRRARQRHEVHAQRRHRQPVQRQPPPPSAAPPRPPSTPKNAAPRRPASRPRPATPRAGAHRARAASRASQSSGAPGGSLAVAWRSPPSPASSRSRAISSQRMTVRGRRAARVDERAVRELQVHDDGATDAQEPIDREQPARRRLGRAPGARPRRRSARRRRAAQQPSLEVEHVHGAAHRLHERREPRRPRQQRHQLAAAEREAEPLAAARAARDAVVADGAIGKARNAARAQL